MSGDTTRSGMTTKTTRSGNGDKNGAKSSVMEEDQKRINADVPKKLHAAVKMRAAQEDTDMRHIIIKALEHYLET